MLVIYCLILVSLIKTITCILICSPLFYVELKSFSYDNNLVDSANVKRIVESEDFFYKKVLQYKNRRYICSQ